jgi:hypothetical protein
LADEGRDDRLVTGDAFFADRVADKGGAAMADAAGFFGECIV